MHVRCGRPAGRQRSLATAPSPPPPLQVTVLVAGKGLASSASYLAIATLKVDSPVVPSRASASSMTVLTLTGRGFDGAACDKNAVDVDGVACPVLNCTAGSMTVLFPGEPLPPAWAGIGFHKGSIAW